MPGGCQKHLSLKCVDEKNCCVSPFWKHGCQSCDFRFWSCLATKRIWVSNRVHACLFFLLRWSQQRWTKGFSQTATAKCAALSSSLSPRGLPIMRWERHHTLPHTRLILLVLPEMYNLVVLMNGLGSCCFGFPGGSRGTPGWSTQLRAAVCKMSINTQLTWDYPIILNFLHTRYAGNEVMTAVKIHHCIYWSCIVDWTWALITSSPCMELHACVIL